MWCWCADPAASQQLAHTRRKRTRELGVLRNALGRPLECARARATRPVDAPLMKRTGSPARRIAVRSDAVLQLQRRALVNRFPGKCSGLGSCWSHQLHAGRSRRRTEPRDNSAVRVLANDVPVRSVAVAGLGGLPPITGEIRPAAHRQRVVGEDEPCSKRAPLELAADGYGIAFGRADPFTLAARAPDAGRMRAGRSTGPAAAATPPARSVVQSPSASGIADVRRQPGKAAPQRRRLTAAAPTGAFLEPGLQQLERALRMSVVDGGPRVVRIVGNQRLQRVADAGVSSGLPNPLLVAAAAER